MQINIWGAHDWVSGYHVMKIAFIEPNFHALYLKFMDLYGSVQLNKQVLRETYGNIKVYSSVTTELTLNGWNSFNHLQVILQAD